MATPHPHIAFEGPIAAGKTTLATLLAKHLEADLLLEEFEGNEFLGDFYADQERWALPMQLWFLSARFRPLGNIIPSFSRPIVADYTNRKDSLFARLLLKSRELRLFNQLAATMAGGPPPNLIVYLDASNDVLLERIQRRGRPYENAIDSHYLDALRQAYDVDLLGKAGINMLRFDTSQLDLQSEFQMNELYHAITSRAYLAL